MEAIRKDDGPYTYADYCAWDDEQRYELIDGIVFAMAPGPTSAHQRTSVNLLLQLATYLKGKQCKVFHAPYDVRLNADKEDNTVVQPDILVICDPSIIGVAGCKGAPDMVVEITSPSTARRDRTQKFDLYLKYGVREYWIVDPDTKTVSVHILRDGEYIIRAYTDADTAPVHVLEGCAIDLSEVFGL